MAASQYILAWSKIFDDSVLKRKSDKSVNKRGIKNKLTALGYKESYTSSRVKG